MTEEMTKPTVVETAVIEDLDISHLVTEDDTSVDNIFSEKQQRLLTEPLYSSWKPDRKFVVFANVGMFYALREPPIVPDVFLSMDVQVHPDWYEKRHRTYLFWEFGKPPEMVIEIVSNQEGREDTYKQSLYARIGVAYYVIFDPTHQLGKTTLHIYQNQGGVFQEMEGEWFPTVGLGIRLWKGVYENQEATWIRWYDENNTLIPTGTEQRQQAEQERQRAETAESEVARLKAELARLRGEDESE